MRQLSTYALVLSTSLLASCAVGPDYQPPDTPIKDRYLAQPGTTSNITAHSEHNAVWWEGFDDPLLSDFVSRALSKNLDLAQAAAQLAQARAQLGFARAALLPSGNISAQTARAYQSVQTPLGQILDSTPGYDRYGKSSEIDVGASWELDVFGGLSRASQAASAEYQASQAGVAAARLAVAAQTADTYITVRGLQARLAIAQQQVTAQQELLDRVQLLYAKGLGAEHEVRETQGELAMAQAGVPVLRAGLDAAMNALDIMLGDPPGTHRQALATATAVPHPPQLISTGSPADLLRRRPDLIVAERRLAASNARIGMAMSEYYPKFSLSALIGSATAISSGNLLSDGANQWAGVLGLRWRLFDFGRVDAQIEQAKGAEAQALAAYRQAALQATGDVENALSSLANREAQAATLSGGEVALAAARQSVFVGYQKGASSLIEVLRADEKLLQISDARALAQTESARSAVAAFKALGGGWQAVRPMFGAR